MLSATKRYLLVPEPMGSRYVVMEADWKACPGLVYSVSRRAVQVHDCRYNHDSRALESVARSPDRHNINLKT